MPVSMQLISPVVCALGGVQLLGLAAAVLARIAEGSRYEVVCQWLCLGALAMIGGLCGFTIQFGPDAAATSAVTLLLMTMIAVIDIRQPC
jgi:hypothetical protein